MAEFSSALFDKCPNCGADAWKSTKYCPFCGTLLRTEKTEEKKEEEPAVSLGYSFRSELAPSEITEEPAPFAEPEEPEKPVLDSNSAFLNTPPVAPAEDTKPAETQIESSASSEIHAGTAPVNPSAADLKKTDRYAQSMALAGNGQKNVNRSGNAVAAEIISKADPTIQNANIGMIVLMIFLGFIGFGIFVTDLSVGRLNVFPLVIFGIFIWLLSKKVRQNSKTNTFVKHGREYDAIVIGHTDSTSSYYSRGSRKVKTTSQMTVRTNIYGRETRILLNVEGDQVKYRYPVGSRVKIVGQGEYWIVK